MFRDYWIARFVSQSKRYEVVCLIDLFIFPNFFRTFVVNSSQRVSLYYFPLPNMSESLFCAVFTFILYNTGKKTTCYS